MVEVRIGAIEVRIISGYGPQENWKLDTRLPFFTALEQEILKAKLHGKAVYIQMDANSKLGPDLIKGDPHEQSDNGRLLAGIIKRNALIVMNNSEQKCKGKITRRRITKHSREESIIDFVIVCEIMEDMISAVVIDEDRHSILTRQTKTKTGVTIKESDHISILKKDNVSWKKTKNVTRVEMYNFKDSGGMKSLSI